MMLLHIYVRNIILHLNNIKNDNNLKQSLFSIKIK